ncbi:hypothetical protein [Mitsuokella multacida]|uniref:hypothetical protein n=1 Tax=Mitsuokella multacida TaxID=52226 RepID=UPI00243061D3|nr:hypothetical protein [Mitsuokella multacida]
MTDFSIMYSSEEKTSKVWLLLDGRRYLVTLNPCCQQGEDVETFYPKQLAIRLSLAYPDIPASAWEDFAYDTFDALQRFDLGHIEEAMQNLLKQAVEGEGDKKK